MTIPSVPSDGPPQLLFVREPLSEGPLVTAYLRGDPAAEAFYSGTPSLDSLREKLHDVQSRFDKFARIRAASALRPTSEAARVRLQAFVEHGGAMVTTGQQAGLFSGPLYTLYKAITTARLANSLQSRLGVTVVPVFWVASEDHDWEEVNHAFLAGGNDGLRQITLSGDPPVPLPMGDYTLDSGVLTVLDELAQVVSGLPFSDFVIKSIRDAYTPGRSVAEAFAVLMAELLAPFDLCITDASDPVVKEASIPLLTRALVEAEAHEEVLAERTKALVTAGFAGQVPVHEGATNVFMHGDHGRVRLYRAGERFQSMDGVESYEREELIERLREEPKRFSPNVFLRPVVESTVFPTMAYVGGPGEISYFAQVNALFDAYGVRAPVVIPRGSVTVVEPPMQRLLAKLDLSLSDLLRPVHEIVDQVARRAMPEEIVAILAELNEAVNSGYHRLIDVASSVDPTLEETLASLRNQVLAKIGDSEKKVVRQLKRKEEIMVGQLERLRSNLRPNGEPQDRVLNVLPLIARYGPEILTEAAPWLEPELT